MAERGTSAEDLAADLLGPHGGGLVQEVAHVEAGVDVEADVAAVGRLDPHRQEAGGAVGHRDPGGAEGPADRPELRGHLGRCLALAEEAQVDVGVVADDATVACRSEQRPEGDPALDPALLAHDGEHLAGGVDQGIDDTGLATAGERSLDEAPLVDEDRDPVGVDEARPALAAAEDHRALVEHVVAAGDADVSGAFQEPT